jgi:hypothetical protein
VSREKLELTNYLEVDEGFSLPANCSSPISIFPSTSFISYTDAKIEIKVQ